MYDAPEGTTSKLFKENMAAKPSSLYDCMSGNPDCTICRDLKSHMRR